KMYLGVYAGSDLEQEKVLVVVDPVAQTIDRHPVDFRTNGGASGGTFACGPKGELLFINSDSIRRLSTEGKVLWIFASDSPGMVRILPTVGPSGDVYVPFSTENRIGLRRLDMNTGELVDAFPALPNKNRGVINCIVPAPNSGLYFTTRQMSGGKLVLWHFDE